MDCLSIGKLPKIQFLAVIAFFMLFHSALYSQSLGSLIEVNPPNSASPPGIIALVNGRLIDGLGGRPVEKATILIKGNRISEVGSGIAVPAEAQVVDLEGMTVLPGLVDAHLHTVNDNNTLNTFLRNGVTTMRDPGHPFRFYQSINFAETSLPRIFLTGAHLDAYPGVYTQQATMIKDHDHVREVIKGYVEKGSSGLKIYFRLPLNFYETVLQSAAHYGIPVVAHMELVPAEAAIQAGLKGIEHVTSFGTSLADPKDAEEFIKGVEENNSYRSEGRYRLWSNIDLKHDRVNQLLGLAAKEEVALCPTLATFERQEGDADVEDYQAAGFNNMLEFVGMAHKAGLKIVVGSHTHGNYAESGWAYQREMELMVAAGMSPLEVITASTLHTAEYLGTSSRLGSIEAGKLADLVVVKGDPSVDIRTMYDMEKVMLNGIWVRD
jgi:imidazolonepropionase-like amidohydrolase